MVLFIRGVQKMNKKTMMNELRELNEFERIGERYRNKYGHDIDYLQYYYLEHHADDKNILNDLVTAANLPEQQFVKARLKDENAVGLSEKAFMSSGRNVELQQLTRYMSIPAHKHEFIELVCVLEGECTHTIDTVDFLHKAGDFTVIPTGISHVLNACENCVCITAKMRVSTFRDCFSGLILSDSILSVYFNQMFAVPYYKCALTFHSGNDEFFRETILHMYLQQKEGKKLSNSIIEHLWIVLFSYLIQNYSETMEFLVFDTVQHSKTIEILNYVFENYSDITLEKTATHFHYSIPYLSRFIKQQTGKNFTELLQQYRLQQASELILHTDMSVDRICSQVGYQNTSQFIRSFKIRFGTTPMKFRKAKHNEKSLPD